MPIRTRRWCDPKEEGDGLRLLVSRYRPRALPKSKETWDEWCPNLGPSRELHADYYGKHGPPIDWITYQKRYLAEMQGARDKIAELGSRVGHGKTVTLLCSSACTDAKRCHRTLLARLIAEAARSANSAPETKEGSARRAN